jgi:two-component system sensor histidine kinase ChiS
MKPDDGRTMKKTILPIIIAVLAAAAVAFGFWRLDRSRQQTFRTYSRLRVLQKAGPARSRLEAGINRRLAGAEALAAFAAANPESKPKEFESFARFLADRDTVLHSVHLTRGGTVFDVFRAGRGDNAFDFNVIADRELADAERARGAALAGPIKTADGGSILIGRVPVYASMRVKAGKDTVARGLVQVLIRPEALFREAELAPFTGNLRFALRGRDGLGAKGGVFFGDERLFKANPVLLEVRFSNGLWQLAAVPVPGWARTAPGSMKFRIFAAAMVLLTGILAYPFSRNLLRLL